jgi:O-antigen/teichoic acid export membrane protein
MRSSLSQHYNACLAHAKDPSTRKHLTNFLWVIGDQVGIRLINFITFAIVARYADASELGVLGLAWTFLYFVEALSSQSLSIAVIQGQSQGIKEHSTFFWLCCASAILGTVAMGCVGAVAWLRYEQDLLGQAAITIGVIFAIRMLGTAHKTVLLREQQQRALSTNSLIASAVSALIGITLALSGFGIWALLIRNATQSILESILNCCTQTWKPRPQFDSSYAKQLIRFSAPLASAQIGNLGILMAQQSGISMILGLNTLGVLEVARRIPDMGYQLFVAVTGRFWFPLIAEKERNTECTKILFKRVTLALTIGALGLVASIFPFREQLMGLIFGQQWSHTGNLFCLLLVGFAINSIQEITKSSLIAKGFTRASLIQLYYSLLNLPLFLTLLLYTSLETVLICTILIQLSCTLHLAVRLHSKSIK